MRFSANLDIIGINPFVFVPTQILQEIFIQVKREKGPIPVKGTINDLPYKQTLVKYSHDWRLYVNLQMLKDSPKRIGESLEVTITYDPEDRSLTPHPKLTNALFENLEAKKVFDNLTRSKQQEIVRYISKLKTEASVDQNIHRTISFLNGNARFLGRDNP
ncbi:MAG: DUF1905 domain-containing protein [Cyclobacteriaceae bacterium]